MKTNCLYINKFILIIFLGISLISCKEDSPEKFITLSKQTADVEYYGMTANHENANFDVGSNDSWVVTYVDSWIHPSHESGNRGRTRIFLNIDENATGEAREGFVVFEANGLSQTFTVNQNSKIDQLKVSPAKITVIKSGFLGTGEKASIYITTNSDWEILVAENSNWIVPEKKSGEAGNCSVNLNIEPNQTATVRSGTFLVRAGSLEALVTVSQTLVD